MTGSFAVRPILERAILSFSMKWVILKWAILRVFLNERFCSLGDSGVGNFEFFNGMGDFAVWAILEWAILSFNVTSDLAV